MSLALLANDMRPARKSQWLNCSGAFEPEYLIAKGFVGPHGACVVWASAHHRPNEQNVGLRPTRHTLTPQPNSPQPDPPSHKDQSPPAASQPPPLAPGAARSSAFRSAQTPRACQVCAADWARRAWSGGRARQRIVAFRPGSPAAEREFPSSTAGSPPQPTLRWARPHPPAPPYRAAQPRACRESCRNHGMEGW